MAPYATDIDAFYSSHTSRDLLARLDHESIPRHVAIIMDGNGRWAKQRGKPRLNGHKAGAAMVREAIAAAIELGVEYLTIYSFSTENWTRPADEVKGIMSLFVEVLERELKSLQEKNVRVRLIGDASRLPQKTRDAFDDCVSQTADDTGLTLVVAVNYGARSDMVDAVRRIAVQVKQGLLEPDDIDEKTIASQLSTAGIPDPDLLIRTGNELRVSNYLLWQIAYAELYFTDVLWPDFNKEQLMAAVEAYSQRKRKFGGI